MVNPQQVLRSVIQDEYTGVEVAVATIAGKRVQFYGARSTADSIEWLDNRDAVFEIGSITKVFTGLLLAEATRRGMVGLDDSVHGHLPVSFKLTDSITFRQLISHSSGLPRLPSQVFFAGMRNEPNPYAGFDDAEMNTWLTEYAVQSAAPGERYEYSNLGMGLVGYALSHRSKTPYADLLDHIVFDKYGMDDTTLDTAAIQNRYVRGIDSQGRPGVHWNLEALAPAGGLLSTAEDMARFAMAHLREDALLAAGREPIFEVNENLDIGMAWHILKDKGAHPWYWHNGATGGYSSSLILIPGEQRAVIVLTNRAPDAASGGIADKIAFRLME